MFNDASQFCHPIFNSNMTLTGSGNWQRQYQKSVTTMSKLSTLMRSTCRNSFLKGSGKKVFLKIVGNFSEKSYAKECDINKVGSLTL